MSTDLAIPEPTRPGRLVLWAEAARCAHELAVSLAQTPFVPKAMANRPGDVTGCILMGCELGLEPMASLGAINIVEGRPSLTVIGMRAVLQQAGHEVWVEESTESRAIVAGQRRGSSHVERVTWTLDMARKAGLAGKQNWTKYPGAMLVARATAAVCRQVASDALLGLPYSVDELDDGDTVPDGAAPATAATVPATAARARTARRRPAVVAPTPEALAATEPPLDGEAAGPAAIEAGAAVEPETLHLGPDAAPEPAGVVDVDVMAAVSVTAAQLRKLMVCYRDAGVTDREARLAHASITLGRSIGSANELTRTEAATLIDALESPPDDADDEPAELVDDGDGGE